MKASNSLYRIPTQVASDTALPQWINYAIPKPGGILLDIGCGDGTKTKMIWQATQAKMAWGVDFNPDKLEEARRAGIQTIEADLDVGLPLDFPEKFFDLIICSEVIEHVFSPDALLDEIVRLLKDDGYLLLTTPNLASWKNRLALLLGWQPFASEVSTRDRYGNPLAARGRPSGHIRLFTLRALLEMVRIAGLRPVLVRGVAAPSPQHNAIGALSRFGDCLFTRFPALADRIVIRLEKA